MWAWFKKHWRGVLFGLLALVVGILGVQAFRALRKALFGGAGDPFLPDKDPHFVWMQGERFLVPDGKTASDVDAAKYNGPGNATVRMKNASIDDL